MSNEKARNITSLPSDAPEAAQEDTTETEKVQTRAKRFLSKNKKFFVGVGTGLATAGALLVLAKADEEEPEVLIVETPGEYIPVAQTEE